MSIKPNPPPPFLLELFVLAPPPPPNPPTSVLSGFDGWSFYTPQMVLIELDEEQPYWIGRQMDSVGAKFTAFINKDHIIPYPDAAKPL